MFAKSKVSNNPAAARAPAAQAPEEPAFLDRRPAPPVLVEPEIKPSVISDAVEFVGDLKSRGALHIDGRTQGTVQAESVTVGSSGSLQGTVRCSKLHVKGRLLGRAYCNELTVAREAVVEGELHFREILVQRGARVTGTLHEYKEPGQ